MLLVLYHIVNYGESPKRLIKDLRGPFFEVKESDEPIIRSFYHKFEIERISCHQTDSFLCLVFLHYFRDLRKFVTYQSENLYIIIWL